MQCDVTDGKLHIIMCMHCEIMLLNLMQMLLQKDDPSLRQLAHSFWSDYCGIIIQGN